MSRMTLSRTLLLLCTLSVATGVDANDFPTVDRVLYVNECMRANPGPHFEMVNKCSCALDRLAGEVKFDDYVTMTTIVNAISIGGERGAQVRDAKVSQDMAKKFRSIEKKAENQCFLRKEE